MKTIVFYFHGYGSSPVSDKVDRLRAAGFETYAFPIDIDPEISLPYLRDRIENTLCDYIDDDVNIMFVGTSLGGWYASELGIEYGVYSILINPSITPNPSIMKYGVPESIADKYFPMQFTPGAKYFIGLEDKVLDFAPYEGTLKEYGATFVEGADHRFNGKEFDLVIDFINSLVP